MYAAAGETLPYATVMLKNLPDSSLNKAAITEAEGQFSISGLSAGNYFLEVRSMGYQTYFSNEIVIDTKDLVLEKIVLPELQEMLGEVEVIARRPIVEVQADKTVFNVEGNLTATGADALGNPAQSPRRNAG